LEVGKLKKKEKEERDLFTRRERLHHLQDDLFYITQFFIFTLARTRTIFKAAILSAICGTIYAKMELDVEFC